MIQSERMKDLLYWFLKTMFVGACFAFSMPLHAAGYYFSSGGNDDHTMAQAQSPATPWKTILKLNELFLSLLPGDTIYLKRNDVFEGTIRVSRSGTDGYPIVLTAYGLGNQPVITGFVSPNNWTAAGNGRWRTELATTATPNMVLFNGARQAIGRYPNAVDPNEGYLGYENFSANQSITDQQMGQAQNWSGGEVVIRKNRWVLDRNRILQHSGNMITYLSGSGYHGSANYGYFIQNHPGTLDQKGEWYCSSGAFLILTGESNAPSSVKLSVVDDLLVIDNQACIEINGLCFSGANRTALRINNGRYITMSHCQIIYSGRDALSISNSDHVALENSLIDQTNDIACRIQNSHYTTIKNNTIKNTGTMPGMGGNDSGSYEAILSSGDHTTIRYNSIDSVGYIPITFHGNDILVSNNFINHFALVKDDGGGIYTWNNGSNPPVQLNRRILNNIVLNGEGAGPGTDDPAARYAHGIYLDDNSGSLQVKGNTVAHCAGYGIFIHNAHDIDLQKNTAFNNANQLVMLHDHIAPDSPVRNILSKRNILFSKTDKQMLADYKTTGNDIADFGLFDSNYYCRPFDDAFVIYSSWQHNGNYISSMYDLQGWKAAFNKDQRSFNSPVKISPYQLTSYTGGNQFSNGNFNTNIGNTYVYSAAGNSEVVWSNGQLDGGALGIRFNRRTGSRDPASVVLGIGNLNAGKHYLLRFSLRGGDENKYMEGFLRQSLAPYGDLSERKLVKLGASRREHEYLFTTAVSETNASIVFDIREQFNPVYLDNIVIREAAVSFKDPDDFIRFEYNASEIPLRISLDRIYMDAERTIHSGTITLEPYSSVVLVRAQELMNVLPVKFLQFTAAKINDSVRLNWSVEEAAGNFTVERSTDGRNFTAIGNISEQTSTHYSFIDVRPLTGKSYYRIRQTGDAAPVYSNVAVIIFETGQLNWQVTPTLAHSQIHISFNKPVDGELFVYTVAGVAVKKSRISSGEANLDISTLPKGTYVVSYSTEGITLNKQFIKN